MNIVMGRRILIDDEPYLLGMGLDISDRKYGKC